MTTEFPVQVDVTSPVRFDRLQVFVRLLLVIVLAWLGIGVGWIACGFYLALPAFAASAISASRGERYLTSVAPQLWRVLAWLVRLSAYMTLLVDRFPSAVDDGAIRIDIRFTGSPTLAAALLRLVTSLPSGLVLMLCWPLSVALALIAAVLVLVGAPIPGWILGFQRGVLRWNARLVAYHASLVEDYPPFSLDTSHGDGPSMRTADALS